MTRGCGLGEDELDALAQPVQAQQDGACTAGGGGCGTGACSSHNISNTDATSAALKAAISRPTDDPSSWSWAGSAARAGRSTSGDAAGDASTSGLSGVNCIKCRQRPAEAIARLSDPMCGECLQSIIMQKLRTSCRTASSLQSGDRVLVALSGGAASLALLHCLQLLQNPNSERQERGLVSFGLEAVHVMQPPELPSSKGGKAALPAAAAAAAVAAEDERVAQLRAALTAMKFQGQLHVLPLHAVFEEQQNGECEGAGQTRGGSHTQPAEEQQPSSLLQQLAAIKPLSQTNNDSREQNAAIGSASPQSADALQPSPAAAPAPAPATTTAAAFQPSQDSTNAAERLSKLLSSVQDATGRQDLATALRTRLLRATATRLHCNKLATGDCATTLAVRIISDAAKGRGFSLPADIQAWDGRAVAAGGPAVLHPLRDATSRELEALCRVQGITPVAGSSSSSSGGGSGGRGERGSKGSINALAEGFVASMQASLPASVFTVLRTASSLQAFPFNSPPVQHSAGRGPAGAVGNGGGARGVAEDEGELRFCHLCDAPLEPSAAVAGQEGAVGSNRGGSEACGEATGVCYSCQRQILAKAGSAGGGVAMSRQEQQAWLMGLMPAQRCANSGMAAT